MPFVYQPVNLGPEAIQVRTIENMAEPIPAKGDVVGDPRTSHAIQEEFISPNRCVSEVFKNLPGAVGMATLMPIYNKNGRAKITILPSDPGDIPGCEDIITDVKSVASANLGSHGNYRVVSRAVYSFYSGLNNHRNNIFPTRMTNGIFGLKDTVTVSYRSGSSVKVFTKTKTFVGNTTAE